MSTQASKFTGSIPQHYDVHLGPVIFEEYAKHLVEKITRFDPESVLEIAAGTGILTRRLRNALHKDCTLMASDLNMPMLEVAREKFQTAEKVQFMQADATQLNFDDDSFDMVVCQFGVMFFPDKLCSYNEVNRVLKPSGNYVFSSWDAWDTNPFAEITHNTIAKYFPDNPPAFYKTPFGYHDPDEIRDALLKTGFTRIAIEHVTKNVPIASVSNFSTGLIFGNPVHEEISMRGGNSQEIYSAVCEAIKQNFDAEMPLKALIIHASR